MKYGMADDDEGRKPDYISQEEWRSIAQRKRKQRANLVVSGLVLCLLGALGYCSYRILSFDRLRNAIVSKLDALDDYEVQIYRPKSSGGMELWRTEIRRGGDWEVQMFGGQLIFVKYGQIFYCHTQHPDQTSSSASWPGLEAFVPRLAAELRGLSFTKFYEADHQIQAATPPGGKTSYRFHIGDEDYELTVGETGLEPIELDVVGPTLDGRGTIEQARFSYRSNDKITDYSGEHAPKHLEQTSEHVLMPGRKAALVVSAGANTFGDCFFEFKDFKPQLLKSGVLRLGSQFYWVAISSGGSNVWKMVCAALAGNAPAWPIKIDVPVLPSKGSSKPVSIPFEVRKASCWLLANKEGAFKSDFDYLKFLFEKTTLRQDFLENSFADAKGVIQYDPDAVAKMPELARLGENETELAANDQLLIWLAWQLYDDSSEGPEDRFLSWVDLGLIEKAAGHPDRALNAFESAASILHRHRELRTYDSYLAANAAGANVNLPDGAGS